MKTVKVWDPLVRLFHWSLVAGIVANGLLLNEESKLHIQVGYVVLGLVAVRIVWGLIGTKHARFSDFPPDLGASLEQARDVSLGRRRVHLGHTPLGALMIYNILATVLLIGASGYMMTTITFWGMEWVEEVHEVFVNWLWVSVVLHVAAVLFESRRTGVNLPRAMVTGRKVLPEWSQSKP